MARSKRTFPDASRWLGYRTRGSDLKELAKSGAIDVDLAAAFDASPNPYMLLTPDLRYAAMNTAYLETVGRTRDELIGRGIFEVFDAGASDVGRENQKQLRDSLNRALASGRRDHLALIHYALPVVEADGHEVMQDRYWSATHTPIRDDSGQIVYVLQHTTDITELEQLRQKLRIGDPSASTSALDAIVSGSLLRRAEHVQEDNRRLETERRWLTDMFMQAPGFIAVLSGPNHVFQMHNDAYGRLIGRDDVVGMPIRAALPELAGQGYFELLDEVIARGTAHEGRASPVTIQPDESEDPQERFVDFIYQPILNESGTAVGILVQGHDVTEAHLADQRQKLMIDELNHRVKNTLATVQSIAMQTARSNPDPARFAQSFQARLLALSHTHDLLTRSLWEGADLRAILEHETNAHGTARVVLNGPAVYLEPAPAVSLGMIFHELATNAAKYGALSVGEGRVFVDWSVTHDARPYLTLRWRETGGPAVATPERRGFGSRLIERNVRHDLAGEVKLSYASDGFGAEISFPLDRGRA